MARILLLFTYPMLSAGKLVGTDLTQAVPLTAAAALGALTFGHVEFGVTASIIVGSVPAVLIGSLLSSRAPDRYIRPAITFVIFASGLKSWRYPPIRWAGSWAPCCWPARGTGRPRGAPGARTGSSPRRRPAPRRASSPRLAPSIRPSWPFNGPTQFVLRHRSDEDMVIRECSR